MSKKSFWKKRIKNTYTLAEYLQEDENKIKELKNGEREIEGKTLDKVLDAIEKEKVNGNIKNVEILQWYKDTDLKALREKFGYKSQADLARELGCNNSTICNFEKKKEGFVKTVAPRLKQLYYFFNNDFNRKPKNEVVDVNVVDKEKVNEDINKGKVILWYNKTSIKGYRICDGKTLKERGEEIGIPPTSLKDLEDKKTKRFGENMVKVYNFYKDRNESNKLEDTKIWDWYLNTDIKALREKEGINQTNLAKKLGLSQPSVGEVENHKTKSISSTLRILYSYYKNDNDEVEEETIPDVKVVVDEESKILQPMEKVEEETKIPYSDIIKMKDLEIEHLRMLNEELKIQIKRYEKLIDRL